MQFREGRSCFKAKILAALGSVGLFSGGTQETGCQNRSLLLKLPSFDSMGSPEGLEAEKGGDRGSEGNMQRKGRGIRALGEE